MPTLPRFCRALSNWSLPSIQTIEELSLNAWPAFQTIIYDGWILRFSQGYTKRANSVNPIYSSTQAVQHKIRRCIHFYKARNLTPIFRITPLAQPVQLDYLLAQRGFEKQSPTSVKVLDLTRLQTAATSTCKVWSDYPPAWENHFVRLHGISDMRAAHRAILRRIVPDTCFAALLHQNRVVACGLGVLENHCVGLFDVVTDHNVRRRGFGKALVLNILHWAKQQEATTAYLQVELGNIPAQSLYRGLGFEEVYQYWYRINV